MTPQEFTPNQIDALARAQSYENEAAEIIRGLHAIEDDEARRDAQAHAVRLYEDALTIRETTQYIDPRCYSMDRKIRMAVARDPQSTRQTLARLALDWRRSVRRTASRTVAERAARISPPPPRSPHDVGTPPVDPYSLITG